MKATYRIPAILTVGVLFFYSVLAAQKNSAVFACDVRVSSDIQNWPGGDTRNWPPVNLMRFRFRAPQRASAEARCGAFRGGGSCRL